MPLLNYTTTIACQKTVGEMQAMLAKAGAQQVTAEYGDSLRPTALGFGIATPFGLRYFRLPVKPEAVQDVLAKDRQVEKRYKTAEQAERVAWRILKDWLAAQLAIIATEMVTLDQVMLPYLVDPHTGATVYELYADQQLALGSG